MVKSTMFRKSGLMVSHPRLCVPLHKNSMKRGGGSCLTDL